MNEVKFTGESGNDFRAHIFDQLDKQIQPVAFLYIDENGILNIETTANPEMAEPYVRALYEATVKTLGKTN